MKIPISWLKEFVDFKESPQALADRLIMTGIDVKEVRTPPKFDGVVVGLVLKVSAHPNADSVRLTIVDVGKKKLEIVCGAPNVAAGQYVPVALIGATLPGGFTIEKRKIRGVESNGMIVSESELGLSSESAGIMTLEGKPKLGSRFDLLLGVDSIIEADITPNRGDQLSILGIAREVAALEYARLTQIKYPASHVTELKKPASGLLKVKVESKKCIQYAARVVEVKTNGESPKWMQERLIACGVRPINCVVDVTNYVMLELGQPMHAFDYEKLSGKQIVVREAKAKESITTLDGVKRELTKDMLVIADGLKPIAVAGVMGGANSEVTPSTKTVVLEAAEFEPLSVRKTAHKLAVRTEAVNRFEKKIDPNLPKMAMERAAHLLQQLCGAEVYEGVIYSDTSSTPLITAEVSVEQLNAHLGAKIPFKEVTKILLALGFVDPDTETKENYISVTVPSFRRDVTIEEDLVEEVARIYGYDKIPSTLPLGIVKEPYVNELYDFSYKLKSLLASMGMNEVSNYSFISELQLSAVGFDTGDSIRISNPISEEFVYMRPSLVPSILANAGANSRYRDSMGIFELAAVYQNSNGSERQREELCLTTVGADSFRRVKGAVEALARTLKIDFELKAASGAADSPALELTIAGKALGLMGVISEDIRRRFDIETEVSTAVLDVQNLFNAASKAERAYVPMPKFPKVTRDISFFVGEDISYEAISKAIAASGLDHLSFKLGDIYRGAQVPSGQKSVTLNMTFQTDRTLTDKEVDLECQKIENGLSKIGAKLRKE